MIKLSRITVYPIKSLDGIELDQCRVLSSGALEHDRRFALVDDTGKFVNAKRFPAIQTIRAEFELDRQVVTLSAPEREACAFNLEDPGPVLAAWVSSVVETDCELIEDPSGGFPDDTEATGPTVVSTGTLETIASWYQGLTAGEVRRRLRANLELNAPEPMWEDQLVGPDGLPGRFHIAEVEWLATGVCQRCPVPARDSYTGLADAGFQKSFAKQREATLPATSPPALFDHFYRVAINTAVIEGFEGGEVRVGDELHREEE